MEISEIFRLSIILYNVMFFPPEDALATLVSDIHFALPSEPDENWHMKEIYWKVTGLHVLVVKSPAGDGETPQLPLSLRLVRE